MSVERSGNNCQAVRDGLTRLVCGDVAEPSPALRSHLAGCAACRGLLAEWRELVGALRTALRPEPLPERLRTHIDARLDAQTVARPVAWSFPLRVACAAAAAALLAAIFMPWSGRAPGRQFCGARTPAVVLSEEDTEALRATWAAWEFMGWESAAEYAVVYLSARIEDVTRTVERDPGAQTLLPWDPEDDWDMPAGDAGAAGARSETIHASSRGGRTRGPAASNLDGVT